MVISGYQALKETMIGMGNEFSGRANYPLLMRTTNGYGKFIYLNDLELVIICLHFYSWWSEYFLHCRCFGQQWRKMEAASAVHSVNLQELWDGSTHHRGQGEGGGQLSHPKF